MLTDIEIEKLKELCRENRQNILKMVYNAQSGHIGGALSATEIMTVLYHKCMNTCPKWTKDKDFQNRDRFVLSKGHASSILYSVLSQLGFFQKAELMTFRLFGSRLQGHPVPICPGIDVATGSLGQGLSIACGIAMALRLDKNPAHVFCLMGDGELQEGSVWEAFMHGAHEHLDNIVAIIDRNRLQIDGCTEKVKALDNLPDKIRTFNWTVFEVDGHNIKELYETIEKAKQCDGPVAIVANTIKGKGVSFMENNAGWHGKAPNKEDFERAYAEL